MCDCAVSVLNRPRGCDGLCYGEHVSERTYTTAQLRALKAQPSPRLDALAESWGPYVRDRLRDPEKAALLRRLGFSEELIGPEAPLGWRAFWDPQIGRRIEAIERSER